MLARALVGAHLLILDEPTNHLDFAGIRWLEEFLAKGNLRPCSFLMTGPFLLPFDPHTRTGSWEAHFMGLWI